MWKSLPRLCRICGEENKTPFSWCKKCRKEIVNKVLSSTTIKDSDMITNQQSHITKKVSWLKSAIRFVIRLAIRIIVRFYKWKERREEERENEMLINKAGARE